MSWGIEPGGYGDEMVERYNNPDNSCNSSGRSMQGANPCPSQFERKKLCKEGKIYNEFGRECEPDLGLWLSKNDWELYEEPIDWQYIIDHECLCWFWEDSKQDKLAQNLNSVDSNSPFMFVDSRNVAYKHCRPVRKDEVTFYEDQK